MMIKAPICTLTRHCHKVPGMRLTEDLSHRVSPLLEEPVQSLFALSAAEARVRMTRVHARRKTEAVMGPLMALRHGGKVLRKWRLFAGIGILQGVDGIVLAVRVCERGGGRLEVGQPAGGEMGRRGRAVRVGIEVQGVVVLLDGSKVEGFLVA